SPTWHPPGSPPPRCGETTIPDTGRAAISHTRTRLPLPPMQERAQPHVHSAGPTRPSFFDRHFRPIRQRVAAGNDHAGARLQSFDLDGVFGLGADADAAMLDLSVAHDRHLRRL